MLLILIYTLIDIATTTIINFHVLPPPDTLPMLLYYMIKGPMYSILYRYNVDNLQN
jgi:hypothetical protein